MRRGQHARPWTKGEERFLAENAGRMPRRDICRELRRSSSSVYAKAHQLRRRGIPVELRCWVPRCWPCPKCGRMRSVMKSDGTCQVCRERDALRRCRDETDALLARLDPAERAAYEAADRWLGSRVDPLPPEPDVPEGASLYVRTRERDLWLLACEGVEIANARRELKAAQKRKERVCRKVEDSEINAKKPVSPDGDGR